MRVALIRGAGRCDFQQGNAATLYRSISEQLFSLPAACLVYPGHDYSGRTVSTIGEEKAYNPRLQVTSVDEYVALMDNLKLANPKMMDVAVPANMKIGMAQEAVAKRGWALDVQQAAALIGRADVVLVDLRESSEREVHGAIESSLHVPYPTLQQNIASTGVLGQRFRAYKPKIVFYCAFGERSAMAVQAAQDAGITTACHIHGGIDAWKKAGQPLVR